MKKLKQLLCSTILSCCISIVSAQPVVFQDLISPVPVLLSGSNSSIVFSFYNNSGATINSIDFFYAINGGAATSFTWIGTSNQGDIDTTAFPVPFSVPSGSYTLCLYTSLANSDTNCYQYAGSGLVAVPFTDDFESGAGTWASSGTAQTWEYGTPNSGQINSAHSPTNSWMVGLNTGYLNDVTTKLYSPVFNYTGSAPGLVSFWQNRNTERLWDGARLEYTSDMGITWNPLGAMNDPGSLNWYTSSSINSSGMAAWDSSSNGWMLSAHSFNPGGPAQVQFRFVFTSDASVTFDGFAIDDFSLDTCNVNVNIDSVKNVSCFGGSDGAIYLTASGGISPYTYQWSGLQTTEDITNLTAGTYTVTVTDLNGCNGFTSAVVTQPLQLQLINSGVIPITCNPGSIIESILGGVPPYIVTDGITSNGNGIFSNYTFQGTYFFSVTDTNGCMAHDTVVITAIPPPVLATPSGIVACSNDSVLICISNYFSGGAPPFAYQWSNGFLADCQYLTAGNYSITVTDFYGCTTSVSFTVTQNSPIVPNENIPADICYYNPFPNQGCLFPTGGSPPYLYQWSTTDTSSCINILSGGTYTCTITDINGCTVTVSQAVNQYPQIQITVFSNPPSCNICNGRVDSVAVQNAFTPYLLTWMGNPNLQTMCDSVPYVVTVTDNVGCSESLGFNFPSGCDSVWPGDANYDGTADNADLLAIGIGYNATGPVRVGASLSWTAQYCDPWNNFLVTQTNYKHIDCNGDGIIDDNDTTAIQQNFGLTHPFRLSQPQNNVLDPPLYFDIVIDTSGTSQQLDIPLMFGTASIPADSIYGLAFTVNYDTALVKSDSVFISFGNSWLGTNSNMLTLGHNEGAAGKLYVGMTRITHSDTSGYGELGRVTVVTTDNVSGRMLNPVYDTLRFSFSDVYVINTLQEIKSVNAQADSLIIEDVTGLHHLLPQSELKIYPNPVHDKLMVYLPNEVVMSSIQVKNMAGENIPIRVTRRNNLIEIKNLETLSNGIYLVQVNTDKGILRKKFSIMN